MSTLRFGTRAKKIKNRVRVNRQLSAEQLAAKLDALVRYVSAIEKENEELKGEVARLGKALASSEAAAASGGAARGRTGGAPRRRGDRGRGRGGGGGRSGRGKGRGRGGKHPASPSPSVASEAGDGDGDASSGEGAGTGTGTGTGTGKQRKGEGPQGKQGEGKAQGGEAPMHVFVRQQLQLEQQQQMIGELLGELANAQGKQGQLEVGGLLAALAGSAYTSVGATDTQCLHTPPPPFLRVQHKVQDLRSQSEEAASEVRAGVVCYSHSGPLCPNACITTGG